MAIGEPFPPFNVVTGWHRPATDEEANPVIELLRSQNEQLNARLSWIERRIEELSRLVRGAQV